ncbi:hypothetical protein [Streptomyces sp. NPDC047009]|uniref:hypothetical protein n=1 Tax=Streptomyces sp. NPDC047009 TaxID=3154496 RepID=UPI00340101D1
MIVSMVSMPEGIVTRADVTEAREQLVAAQFLLVDVESPEEASPGDRPVAHHLGLEAESRRSCARRTTEAMPGEPVHGGTVNPAARPGLRERTARAPRTAPGCGVQ